MARIYVADLAAYNAGHLHGEWIDLEGLTSEDVQDRVQLMLQRGQHKFGPETLGVHEEWAIHDYEGFMGIRVSEWGDFETLVALSDALADHGEPFAVFVEDIAGDLSQFADVAAAVSAFEEAYQGNQSLEDYSYTYAKDVLELTGTALDYFDAERFGQDLECGGDIIEHRGYLFSSQWD